MRLLKFAGVLFAIATAQTVRAIDPPPALFDAPPVARVDVDPRPKIEPPVYDAKASCVAVTSTNGSGSGTCIANEGGKSLVITNNHVVSPGQHPQEGWRDDMYPVSGTVTHGTKTYNAVAISGDRMADVALVVVDGDIPPARIAEGVPPIGDKVWRNGMGSGYQTCVVARPDPTFSDTPRMGFVVDGKSVSGDSGSGYFNSSGELVAVHCGQDQVGRPRGTAVTSVTVVVREKSPRLFERLRNRLAARRAPTVTAPMVAPLPPPALIQPKALKAGCPCGPLCACKDGDCPAKCPVAKPTAPSPTVKPARLSINGVTHELRSDGYYWPVTAATSTTVTTYTLPTAGPTCTTGNCQIPSSTGRRR